MDKVGNHGRGESVWLAFFLYDTLMKFVDVAELKKDAYSIEKYKGEAAKLKKNIDKNAWDGSWYRRGYFDNGDPLGSALNDECKIDSIAQSWSLLSRAGDHKKSVMALQSADTYLVRKDLSLIQLFTPPFDKSDQNPGYIKGYVPGVRENGGQYTHAAIWLIMAFASVGDYKRTWELIQMINPINHGKTPDEITTYKVEPYVIAADVYALPQYAGRGVWTWYTGSAGWMYQLIIEYFLGLKRKGNTIQFEPCLPTEWEAVGIRYKYQDSHYDIRIVRGTDHEREIRILVDGVAQQDNTVYLLNDKENHQVEVRLAASRVEAQRLLAMKTA